MVYDSIRNKYLGTSGKTSQLNTADSQPPAQAGGSFSSVRQKYLGNPSTSTVANTSADRNYDLYQLAAENNVPVDQEPPASFQKLLDVLNAPSHLTEQALTRGSSYDKLLDQIGVKNTKGQIDANDVISEAGRFILDPLNLVAPLGIGAKILKGAQIAGKAAKMVKPIGSVSRGVEDLFKPMARVNRVSPQLATELPGLETATRAKQVQAARRVGEMGKEFSPDVQKNLGKLTEKAAAGEKLTTEEALAVAKAKKFIQENITDPEALAGISPNLIADYFPRVAERKAVQESLSFGGEGLSMNLGGSEKARKFATQVEGEAKGVEYKNALDALAIRASRSEAARSNAGFIKRLIDGEIKDINGEGLVASIGKGKMSGYEEFTVKGLKGFQAPTEAVKEIEKYYKTFTSDDATNTLLKYYDKGLNLWKSSVTSLFPAYHLRNAIGNLSNMWLGGFTDVRLLGTAARIQKGKAVTVKGTRVNNDLLEQLGLGGKGFYGSDVPKVLDETIRKPGFKQMAKDAVNLPRDIGSTVEDNARIALFIDRLNKGDSVAQATGHVKKFLFDYTALTPFEKNVMKRIMPFYTWTRKNIPLQVEQLIKQPGKAAVWAKLANLSPLSEDEEEAVPGYMKDTISTKVGGPNEEGAIQVLTGVGLPFEDLGRLVRESPTRTAQKEILATMYPWGNIIGAVADKDFFRGKDISESAYSYGRQSKDLPQPVKDFLEFRTETSKDGESYYYVNPQKYYALTSVIGRLMRVVGQPNLEESALTAIAPGRIEDISIKEGKEINQAQKEKEIEKRLKEKGALKEFKKTYKPKEH